MQQGIRFPLLPLSGRSSRLRSTTALVYVAACVLACAAGGCGSTVATSTGPSPAKCAVTLTAPDLVTASGATTTVAVATQPECAWSASSEAAWITGLAPASGQGNGQLQMRVAANPNTSARQGDIVVNGERAQIRQDAAPCRFELSAVGQTMSASGGNGTITVTTAAACAWTAQSDAPWVVITAGPAGTGAASVNFTIAPNTGSARTASLVIADQMVKITQEANVAPLVPPLPGDCSYTVTAMNISAPASGTDASSVSVSAPSRCEWFATSNSSWISVTGRTSGSGDGTVTFSISSNTGATRTGTLTIGGQTVTVTQASASCSYSVSPSTVSVPSTGSAGTSESVTASTGCPWTAVSTVAWISIASGSSGTANSTVSFTVAANAGAARTGTVTIAGQTVTVNQAAVSCSYSINPTTLSIGAGGGTAGPLAVTAAAGCTWTATTSTSWLSVTSGASGTGNGTVAISVAANTGGARTGTLTVANQTVTVTQAAAPCSYSVTPTNVSIGAAGGTGTPISVSTSSGCTWTSTGNVSWLMILSGASGTGGGSVTYSVQPNTGPARTGTLTVAGQTVMISQSTGCVYAIAPASQTFEASGGTGGPVAVTAPSGCAWTAVSNANWITVTTGSSGSGSGSVTFTVAANTGGQRTGTLTIAGLTFTVTEKK